MPVRVSGRAAVAHTDVQVPIGTEGQVPPIVVGVRLLDVQQIVLARWIGLVSAGVDVEAGHKSVASCPGVIDIEIAGLSEVGVECQAEQAPFEAVGVDPIPQVQEGLPLDLSILVDHDRTWLLNDEQPSVAGRLDIHRAGQPGDHRFAMPPRPSPAGRRSAAVSGKDLALREAVYRSGVDRLAREIPGCVLRWLVAP